MDFHFSKLLWDMNESWNYQFEQEIDQLSEQTIQRLVKCKTTELAIFLSYYFQKEGAIAERVVLSSPIEFIDLDKGKFKLAFDLIHFNACLAIHDQKQDDIEINFEFDSKSKNLCLRLPYRPEREMDEI